MHLSIDARSKLRVIRGGANDEIVLAAGSSFLFLLLLLGVPAVVLLLWSVRPVCVRVCREIFPTRPASPGLFAQDHCEHR